MHPIGIKGGRPQGPERVALLAAAQELDKAGRAATWQELAALAKVGRQVARVTCWSMVRAGELEVVGYAVKATSTKGRPPALLRLAKAPDIQGAGVDALVHAMRGWA